jgi:capsular exopolysaccharide synthesis family protein
MAASVAFGVVFGLLLAYLFELADQSFRSGDDIRAVLGLPCMAMIPRIPRHTLRESSVEDFAVREPSSPFAEQFRALRAGLAIGPERPRVVAITAARPDEGTSTATLALARIAAQNGERVIMLDCDHGGPRDTPETRPGLLDYLRGQVKLADIIRHDEFHGIDHVSAGTRESNALSLRLSDAMAHLLQRLRMDYDLVLLDTPPAQAVTDARIIAGLADATLLCVRWRATPRNAALNALELLEEAHANVVGAALTQVDVSVHLRSGYADAEVYHPHYGGFFRE